MVAFLGAEHKLSTQGSVVVAHGLHSCGSRILELKGFSSCGRDALLLHSKWDLPEAGTEPVSLMLAEQILNHWTAREAPRYVVIK